MNQNTAIKHIGLQFKSRESAEIFFTKILDLNYKKSFKLSKELTKKIFDISEEVPVEVFDNDKSYFEIFISQKDLKKGFEHVCIQIRDKKKLIEDCKRYGIKPIVVKKGEKELLFIKDFSGNLYEIKEKK